MSNAHKSRFTAYGVLVFVSPDSMRNTVLWHNLRRFLQVRNCGLRFSVCTRKWALPPIIRRLVILSISYHPSPRSVVFVFYVLPSVGGVGVALVADVVLGGFRV